LGILGYFLPVFHLSISSNYFEFCQSEQCFPAIRCWWLRPVILATLEAELGKIVA
jgi:hypothetical protein